MEIVQPLRSKQQIEDMKSSLVNPRDRLLFIIGINSGLRISDLLTLKVGDVRGKDSLILVVEDENGKKRKKQMREQKTKKSKTFRFNKSIKNAVAELIPQEASDSDWLFPSRKGDKPITRVQAYRILNDAAQSVGIEDQIGCHTLRKTWGYWAYQISGDIATIQTTLNHSHPSVTLRYIGITQDMIDDLYDQVEL